MPEPGQILKAHGGQIAVRVEVDTPFLDEGTFGIYDVSEYDDGAVYGAEDPEWADITPYVLSANTRVGKDRWEQRFQSGSAQFLLDNTEGIWTPDTDLPTPWYLPWRPGRRIRIVAIPDPTSDPADPASKVALFTGEVDSATDRFGAGGYDLETHVVANDFMARLARINPLALETPTGVQTTSQRVHAALDRADWPMDKRDIQAGFHTMQSSHLAQSVLEECQRAAEAEGGAFFITADGVATFRNREWLTAPLVDDSIAHDAATEHTHTGTSTSFNHTPSGTPKGVLVFISHPTGLLVRHDVTYGGKTLKHLGTSAAPDFTQNPVMSVYFLGSNVPPGVQEVEAISNTSSSLSYHFVCITVTADSDQVRVADLTTTHNANGANPQTELNTGSQVGLRYVGIMSQHLNPSSLTSLVGQTTLHDHDHGSFSTKVDRQTTPGSGDTTVGFTAASTYYSMIGVALTGDNYTRSTEIQGYIGFPTSPTPEVYDDFEGAFLDVDKWDEDTIDWGGGEGSVSVANGVVEIGGPQDSETWIETADPVSLRGKGVSVKVVKHPDIESSFEGCWFYYYIDFFNYISFRVQRNSGEYWLFADVVYGGSPFNVGFKEDYGGPGTYLRIRESFGTIYFESSADGELWTVDASYQHGFSPEQLESGIIQLGVYAGGSSSPSGGSYPNTAEFDDVTLWEFPPEGNTAHVLDVKPSWETARIRNDIQLARVGGTIYQAFDQASIDLYDRRSYRRLDYQNNLQSEIEFLADRMLAAWKDNRYRIDSVTIAGNADPDNEDLNRLLWDTRFGDLVSVLVRTSGGEGWSYQVLQTHVMGIEHRFQADDWIVTFMLDDSEAFQDDESE